MPALDAFRAAIGADHVLTEQDAVAPHVTDWTGGHTGVAMAVLLPGSTPEVAALVRVAAEHGVRMIPQGGNTGVAAGATPPATGQNAILSTVRLDTIHAIDTAARTATAGAGVVLERLQTAVADHGLEFPVMFGARGTAQLGGVLATNAGGANVLRYGNTRDLCLGVQAVLADGTVIDTLAGLRKDNSGYDLRHLLIGSEGTLGIITAATLRLTPTPLARATAFLALKDLDAGLSVLNRLQDASGGLVDACEWLPREMIAAILEAFPTLRAPLAPLPAHGLLVELASTRPSDTGPVLDDLLLTAIEAEMGAGRVTDGVVATSDAQRQALWAVREAVLPAIVAAGDMLTLDVALPLARMSAFVAKANAITETHRLRPLLVAHLGDGNVHYSVVAPDGGTLDAARMQTYSDAVLEVLREMGGSYSAEHGIGRAKAALQAQWKDPAALAALRAVKDALDPQGLLNPGALFCDGM
ncbi:MAG: FAD-binding oxidoreductase [Pseudomonadota bacterium]